jgi:hypothetical protein
MRAVVPQVIYRYRGATARILDAVLACTSET